MLLVALELIFKILSCDEDLLIHLTFQLELEL